MSAAGGRVRQELAERFRGFFFFFLHRAVVYHRFDAQPRFRAGEEEVWLRIASVAGV